MTNQTEQGAVESRAYSDGTVATGLAPLPPASPAQQHLLSDLDAIEAMLGGKNGPTIRLRAALLAGFANPTSEGCGPAATVKESLTDAPPEIRGRVVVAMDEQHERVMLDLCSRQGLTPDQLMRQALRVYQADLLDSLPKAQRAAAAEPVATIRTWTKGARHAVLEDWGDGLEALPDGTHQVYAAPSVAEAAADEMRKALDFLAGLHGNLTIDTDQPLKMADAIFEHVRSELNHYRDDAERCRAELVSLAAERAELARWKIAQAKGGAA